MTTNKHKSNFLIFKLTVAYFTICLNTSIMLSCIINAVSLKFTMIRSLTHQKKIV